MFVAHSQLAPPSRFGKLQGGEPRTAPLRLEYAYLSLAQHCCKLKAAIALRAHTVQVKNVQVFQKNRARNILKMLRRS